MIILTKSSFFILILLGFHKIVGVKRKSNKYVSEKSHSRIKNDFGLESSEINNNFLKEIQENCKEIVDIDGEIDVNCSETDICKFKIQQFEEFEEVFKLKICKCCLDDFSEYEMNTTTTFYDSGMMKNDLESSIKRQEILNKLLPCVNVIYRNYLVNSSNIVYFHKDTKIPYLNLHFPVTIFLPNKPNVNVNKIDSYILVLSKENYKEEINFIVALPTWSPRAKIILICSENLQKLFKFIIYHYIYNVIAIVIEDKIEIYTNFPFVEENMNNPVVNPEVLNLNNLFPNKLPVIWRNSTLIVSPVLLYPYVICAQCGTGLDLEVSKLLSDRIKFTLVIDQTFYENWGIKQADGIYDGAIDTLRTRTSDFVVGYFHLRDPTHMIDFEYTFSYTVDDVVWAIPSAAPLSHWTNIIHIFDKTIWVALIMTLLFLSMIWLYVGKISKHAENSYYRTNYIIEIPLMLIIEQSIHCNPQSFKFRVIFIITWIFCFIIVTSWNSYLFYYLTHDTYPNKIKTTQHLIDSDLIMGIHPELGKMYHGSGSKIGIYIGENFYACNAGYSCMDRAATKKDMAVTTSKRIFKYILQEKYKIDGKNALYILDERVIKDYVVLYLQKGHPLFERVNYLLIQFCSAGFIQYLDDMQDFYIELSHGARFSDAQLFAVRALSLRQILGTFYLLGVGLVISSLVFFTEIYISYMSRRKELKKHIYVNHQ